MSNINFTLTYTAGANGTLSGTTSQTVTYGLNGTAVTAQPNPGFAFVSWSDGGLANPRTDTNVTNNLSVTANFVNVTPPVIGPALNLSGGSFNFQFTGTPGQHYRVEYTPSLPASGAWQTLTDILSLAASPFAVSVPTTNGSGFYRVGLIP